MLGGLAFDGRRAAQAELYLSVFGGRSMTESKTTQTRLAIDGTTLLDGKSMTSTSRTHGWWAAR